MELVYKIPFGTMAVQADEFFREAGRRQIRKMLKDYNASRPDPKEVDRLKTWLQEQIGEEKQKQEQSLKMYSHASEQLRILERNYQYDKAYCDNEEKREAAKEAVRECKARMRQTANKRTVSQRAETRYCGALDDVKRIFDN